MGRKQSARGPRGSSLALEFALEPSGPERSAEMEDERLLACCGPYCGECAGYSGQIAD
jgi:hypothetical protein